MVRTFNQNFVTYLTYNDLIARGWSKADINTLEPTGIDITTRRRAFKVYSLQSVEHIEVLDDKLQAISQLIAELSG